MITDIDLLDPNKQYTYADYMTWQFQERVELIRGWVRRMSPVPLRLHQTISFNLSGQIRNYLKGKTYIGYSAPFDVRLINKRKSAADKDIVNVVQPDICVVCDQAKLDDRGCIGAPDWVMEILSKGNTKLEMKEKFFLYEENGVREYWIVFPEYEHIQVFDLKDEKFVLRGTYVKGDDIPVGIFPDLLIETTELFPAN
jgi:Uma2 family endonuclease